MFTQANAGARLGISARTLDRMASHHPLYRPAVRSMPGRGGEAHGRFKRYLAYQIDLIAAAMAGAIDPDTAHLKLSVYLANLCKEERYAVAK